MQIHQGFANGEAEPQSAKLAGDLGAALLKGIEHMGKAFGRNANAVIFDPHFAVTVRAPRCADMDGAILGSELDGVFQHIPQHLLKAGGVCRDHAAPFFEIGLQED